MMSRFMFLVCLLCVASHRVYSDQPARTLIAVANLETASMLAPLGSGDALLVLVQRPDEPIRRIDSRAWMMRTAKHFVFDSRHETMLEALYRERLEAQGVNTIDLNEHSKPRHWQDLTDIPLSFMEPNHEQQNR